MLDMLDTLDMLDMLNTLDMLDILRDASSSVLHDPNILKSCWRPYVLFGGYWYPCFIFLASGFQSQSGFCLICFSVEANVMYIPQDPPFVLHLLTSWQPAS